MSEIVSPSRAVADILRRRSQVPERDRSRHVLAAVPVVAASIWVLWHSAAFRWFQQISVGMVVHELGHAVASWLGGVAALPLPLVTLGADHRSALGFAIAGSLVLAMLWKGWSERLPAWIIAAAVCIVAMLELATRSDDDRWILITAAGIGGEFVLGSVFVSASLWRLSRQPNWQVQRFGPLLVGMMVLVPAYLRWVDISRGLEPLPLGSALLGEDNGDMNVLLDLGYSPATIIHGYLQLGRWCLGLVVVNWLALAVRVAVARLPRESR